MKKSNLKTAFVFVLILFCSSVNGQDNTIQPCDDKIVEKVKMAMLCMQRYSWEHGTAMQAMLEIGVTSSLIIMARESVQLQHLIHPEHPPKDKRFS